MTTRTKKVKHIKTVEVAGEIAPVKIKKSFDFEVGDPIIPEKIDEVVDAVEETEDAEEAETETPSLDDDEVNPFKDKWEE